MLTDICLHIVASAQALRNAGLIDAPPKKERSDFTSAESTAESDWRLSREHRDETGVVFASSFPALDSLIEELSRAMANAVDRTRAQTRKQARDEWLRGLHEMATRRAQEEQAADEGDDGQNIDEEQGEVELLLDQGATSDQEEQGSGTE